MLVNRIYVHEQSRSVWAIDAESKGDFVFCFASIGHLAEFSEYGYVSLTELASEGAHLYKTEPIDDKHLSGGLKDTNTEFRDKLIAGLKDKVFKWQI